MTDIPFKIATAQMSVSPDVKENGEIIRSLIKQAGSNKARLIQFPEGALSGYVKTQIKDWRDVDWLALNAELAQIARVAKDSNIWVVLGSNHRLTLPNRPCNSLYVISDQGHFVERYDKQICSHTEISSWYSPGDKSVVFDVDGYRFGCTLCIEIHFPQLYSDYEQLGIDCMLFSAYSEDPMFAVKAQAHASNYCYWFSLSVVSNGRLPSQFIGPTGDVMNRSEPSTDGLIFNHIDKAEKRWEVPLMYARPWRRTALVGEIYAPLLAETKFDERNLYISPLELGAD